MLGACLEGAAALDPAPREVIVAIDGDSPAVRQAAEGFAFRTASLPHTPGISAARNAGALIAKA